MSKIEILSTTAVTPKGGMVHRVKHESTTTQTKMIFAIFLPASYKLLGEKAKKSAFPTIYWLSGLTCKLLFVCLDLFARSNFKHLKAMDKYFFISSPW